MAKKENTGAGEQVNKLDSALSLHPVLLIIGPWKQQFTDQQTKIIIAEALNYCTRNKGLRIVGYLITKRRLCLVLQINKAHVNAMLRAFYDTVRRIKNHHGQLEADDITADDGMGMVKTLEPVAGLFEEYPLNDDHLIKLITGRKVNLRYYNPELEKLKDRINREDFCSAIDYSGAVGPVLVKLRKR